MFQNSSLKMLGIAVLLYIIAKFYKFIAFILRCVDTSPPIKQDVHYCLFNNEPEYEDAIFREINKGD